jgi:hypothetical protein
MKTIFALTLCLLILGMPGIIKLTEWKNAVLDEWAAQRITEKAPEIKTAIAGME